jgi:hypothetical protein
MPVQPRSGAMPGLRRHGEHEQALRRLFGLESWEPLIAERIESSAAWDRAAFAGCCALEHALRVARR